MYVCGRVHSRCHGRITSLKNTARAAAGCSAGKMAVFASKKSWEGERERDEFGRGVGAVSKLGGAIDKISRGGSEFVGVIHISFGIVQFSLFFSRNNGGFIDGWVLLSVVLRIFSARSW